jgi:hypothetical protein
MTVRQGYLSGLVAGLRRDAAELAAGLSARARRSTTIAQQRAILRMIGVDGLDRAGQPLASSVAESYCGGNRGRLASGVLLPFAVARLEYELPVRNLALDVAAGSVDLGLEADLLQRPERLAAARAEAARLLGGALERVDANRTAARDLRDVLGPPLEPWLGLRLQSYEAASAADEISELILGGADVVQVEVPASWEYAQARRQSDLEAASQLEQTGAAARGRSRLGRVIASSRRRLPGGAFAGAAAVVRPEPEAVPAGSQRGLSSLRAASDEAAAERGCYAAMMTITSALAAPEQAVVAAFERIDMVGTDAVREIVEANVDPDRALADYAFAHRLHARAGTTVVIGAGPLAIGADVARGVPADAATSAGRALALQALAAEIALADGLPADRLLVGAVPTWVAQEGGSRAVLVQAGLRRLLFPELRLALEQPRDGSAGVATVVAALSGAPAGLVLWERSGRGVSDVVAAHRAAADSGAALRSGLGDGSLTGEAAEQAHRIVVAAAAALEKLAGEGWESLLGPSGDRDLARYGGATVAEVATGPGSTFEVLADLL